MLKNFLRNNKVSLLHFHLIILRMYVRTYCLNFLDVLEIRKHKHKIFFFFFCIQWLLIVIFLHLYINKYIRNPNIYFSFDLIIFLQTYDLRKAKPKKKKEKKKEKENRTQTIHE